MGSGKGKTRRASATRPKLETQTIEAPVVEEIGKVTPAISPTIRREVSRNGSGPDEPWNVIVLNDDHNSFEHVAQAIGIYIPGMTLREGRAHAIKIDKEGSSVVWSGHFELAELYWEQLNGEGLTMAPLQQ